ncbi:MAG: hypothetical protein C0471_18410 [Erythrobacter sp.]|nr:hypothetical protein [Erythrobacter sp.]
MKLRNHLLGGIALALAPAAALMAQESATATAPVEETVGNEIVVEGYTEKQVRNFLWRAVIETGNVMAKRDAAVCVGIDNAPVDLSQPLRQRIEGNLKSLDIEVGEPGCKVNAVIVFDRDAHRFVNWLADQNAGVAYASLYLPERRRLIKPVRSVYNWHVLDLGPQQQLLGRGQTLTQQGAEGGRGFQGAEFDPGGRILAAFSPAETSLTFSVVDYDAIDGLTIEQLGDYLTMQMLVEFRPDMHGSVPPDSILNLFTDKGSDPDAAPEMSALDRVILSEIYGNRQNFGAGAVRASIARKSVERLEETGSLRGEP